MAAVTAFFDHAPAVTACQAAMSYGYKSRLLVAAETVSE